MSEAFSQPAVIVPLASSIIGFATLWVKQHYSTAVIKAQLECQAKEAADIHRAHTTEVHAQVAKLQDVAGQLVETQAAIQKQQGIE